MMQRRLRFEILDSHNWNFKNLNATTRQQMALQGKILKKLVLMDPGHRVWDKFYKNNLIFSGTLHVDNAETFC
jgi:hypothetical protein